MTTSNALTQYWIDFIDLYKSFPQLWKNGHKDYVNRSARNVAYKLLLEKYREFDKGASMDHVKKKISNMRTSYRRELQKVNALCTYKPKLWYYPYMDFLREQEADIYNSEHGSQIDSDENISQEETETKTTRKRKHNDTTRLNFPILNNGDHNQFNQLEITPVNIPLPDSFNRDDAQIFSASWEVLLSKLDSQQRFYANRIITDVLYLGALKELKSNTYGLLEQHSSKPKHQENPVTTSVNAENDENQKSEKITNINDALSALKQLELYAEQKNQNALDLIFQIEDLFESSMVQAKESQDEDDSDFEDY